MDVDESFAEYAAARWSMLYRLATLLAGPEEADELTQAALVRAYLSWPEVRQAASPDGYVKRLLVRTAVGGRSPRVDTHTAGGQAGVEGGGGPSPAGRERLWAQISALLPRQRAVLVLRHYEGLSDAEIGDALGWSANAVAAEALALETGVDLADLRDVLLLRSDEVQVPLPPLDSLLSRGRLARRRRRRRSWEWAVGVAAAVAVGLTVTSLVQGISDRPRPPRPPAAEPARFLAMLPSGRPPRTAYSVGRSLHLGSGRRIVLDEEASTIVQTRKWLFVGYLSGAIVRVDTVRGKIATVASSSRGELVTDPGGQHVAWLAAGAGPAVVVVRTVSDWSVLLSDEQRFPAKPRCCDNPFVVNGMTGSGEVIASLPAANRAWVWRTPDAGSTQVREISGLGNGVINQVAADGVVVRYPPHTYAVGSLHDGIFRRTAVLTATEADFGDPFSRRVVYADDTGEIHVRERVIRGRSRRPSQDVRLLLPTLADGFAGVRWEDPEHVLLDVTDASMPHGALVRCDVLTGACEIAARFDGPHLVAD